MEFDYELTQEDIKLYRKEAVKYGLDFNCLRADTLLFCQLIFYPFAGIFLFAAAVNMSFRFFIILYIGCIIFTFFLYYITAKFAVPDGRFHLFTRKPGKYKLFLSHENINLYMSDNYFSCNTSQIKEISETYNFYVMTIKHQQGASNLAVPKRDIEKLESKNEFFYFLHHYETKDKKLKNIFEGRIESWYIILLPILIIYSYIFLPHTHNFINKQIGITIIKSPCEPKMHPDASIFQERIEAGDIIEINGYNIINKTVPQIEDAVKKSNPAKIKVIKRDYTDEAQMYEIRY